MTYHVDHPRDWWYVTCEGCQHEFVGSTEERAMMKYDHHDPDHCKAFRTKRIEALERVKDNPMVIGALAILKKYDDEQ